MQAAEQRHIGNCASCGQVLTGKFCSQCGEKVFRDEDKTVKHFFAEFFHMLIHADSKFLKSLKHLLTKPGFLTKEYITGRRKLYSSPLSLFLIGNVLYLLWPPVDALNSHYQSQLYGQPYSQMIVQQGAHKMEQKKWTPEQMEERYNRKSSKVAKILMIVLVFLFSIPISILFFKRDYYYADHLVYATEFVNFIIYVVLLILPYLIAIAFMLAQHVFNINADMDLNSDASFLTLFLVLWTFLYISAKRVYGKAWLIPKTLLLTLSTGFVVILYRYILFQVTLLML